MITFYATPKFPSSNCSYDVQICPLFFAPCLTHLFVLPCTDPSTRPRIQESDVQVTCRLNFWFYYFPFWIFALWNAVPSRPFSPCSWLDPLNLSRCVRLSLSIYNCSPSVLMRPLTNNFVDSLTWLSCSEMSYFTWIYFHRIFNRPLPQPVQIFLQFFHVLFIYNFSVNYKVISKSLIVDSIFLQTSFT